jgi:dihydroorotate dehydrogenase
MPKFDLVFSPPLMNASGSLGFAPDPHGPLDLARLGAFVTNPISLAPRQPAGDRQCLEFPGGFLLHSGYPNPGFRQALLRYAGRWSSAPLPVLVHLLLPSAERGMLEDLAGMVRRLESLEGVMGIELGLPPGAEPGLAPAAVQACLGELPLVVRLPLEQASELASELAASPVGQTLAAVSLGPPRGLLPLSTKGLAHGRLYGPGLFPLALAAVQAVLKSGLPVIGAGGIFTEQQIQAMLSAGATGVQLDAVLWRGGISPS